MVPVGAMGALVVVVDVKKCFCTSIVVGDGSGRQEDAGDCSDGCRGSCSPWTHEGDDPLCKASLGCGSFACVRSGG